MAACACYCCFCLDPDRSCCFLAQALQRLHCFCWVLHLLLCAAPAGVLLRRCCCQLACLRCQSQRTERAAAPAVMCCSCCTRQSQGCYSSCSVHQPWATHHRGHKQHPRGWWALGSHLAGQPCLQVRSNHQQTGVSVLTGHCTRTIFQNNLRSNQAHSYLCPDKQQQIAIHHGFGTANCYYSELELTVWHLTPFAAICLPVEAQLPCPDMQAPQMCPHPSTPVQKQAGGEGSCQNRYRDSA